ncbi:heparinase II/III family protein [Acuticoccus kandeliae]|uniref:heparinase II/III family protein n=1 Tax=Acuticoccus kandeliae TaxID=2073160 RepID=UPI000D3E54C2|nr:heparinase II/III family protein [Acuticoccus kandeliae]
MSKSGPTVTTFSSLIGFALRRLSARVLAGVRVLLWQRPVSVIPARVMFAPEALVDPDPAVAADIYAGVFALAGVVVDASARSPFMIDAPSPDWARALHSFGWLHHLDAQADRLSSSNARALFDEWLAAPSANGDIANEPDVMADRLYAWLVQSPLLLIGADPAFRQRYMRALGRHMRRLERALALLPKGMTRLRVAATLAIAGTVIADEGRLARKAMGALADAVSDEILPDGGHASRSPEALLTILAVLIPLREALTRRQLPTPDFLRETIDRVFPMLRFFRYGDGGLATFHGTGIVSPALMEAALDYDDVQGHPAPNARYSGYQRLAAGGTVVLFDTGRAPPPSHAQRAHASTLAFEFAHGATRLVVNCGALERARPDWIAAARASAAQSTLVIAERSSAKVLERWPLVGYLGPVLYRGPRRVDVTREGLTARADHDGYHDAFGLLHERTLALSDDGLWLDGTDRLIGPDRLDGYPFVVRFHLGPNVKARLEPKRNRVLMTLPDSAIWLFGLDEGPGLALEDSIVLVGPRQVRRTTQIVVAGNSLTDDTVRWHIARHAAPLDIEAESAEDIEPE